MNFFSTFKQTLKLTDVSLGRLFSLMSLMLVIGSLDVLGVGFVPVFLASLVTEDLSTLPVPATILEPLNSLTQRERVLYSGGILALVFSLKNIFAYWGQATLLTVTLRELSKLKARLFKIYQQLPYSFHIKTDSAEILTSILQRATHVTENALMGFLRLAADTIVAVPLLALLLTTSTVLSLTLIATLCLFLLYYSFSLRPKLQSLGKMPKYFLRF